MERRLNFGPRVGPGSFSSLLKINERARLHLGKSAVCVPSFTESTEFSHHSPFHEYQDFPAVCSPRAQ